MWQTVTHPNSRLLPPPVKYKRLPGLPFRLRGLVVSQLHPSLIYTHTHRGHYLGNPISLDQPISVEKSGVQFLILTQEQSFSGMYPCNATQTELSSVECFGISSEVKAKISLCWKDIRLSAVWLSSCVRQHLLTPSKEAQLHDCSMPHYASSA